MWESMGFCPIDVDASIRGCRDYLLGMCCGIESLIIIRGWQGLPSELTDDLLALDSKVRFDFSDRRLELTATLSIPTNSDGGGGGGSVDVVSVVSVTLEGTSADAVRALKIWRLRDSGVILFIPSCGSRNSKRSLGKAFERISAS
ncbi:hypothetical protein Tco_1475453 [Tanacetum coccineum]